MGGIRGSLAAIAVAATMPLSQGCTESPSSPGPSSSTTQTRITIVGSLLQQKNANAPTNVYPVTVPTAGTLTAAVLELVPLPPLGDSVVFWIGVPSPDGTCEDDGQNEVRLASPATVASQCPLCASANRAPIVFTRPSGPGALCAGVQNFSHVTENYTLLIILPDAA